MNLNHFSVPQSLRESVASEQDLDKLINICNSYGLNEDQTAQLIEEFKRGALFKSTQSLNDSLNQTLNEITFTENNEGEQYSFKHLKEHSRLGDQKQGQRQWIYMEESKKTSRREDQPKSIDCLERLLQEKFTIEKDLVANLQEENKRLRASLDEKDSKIEDLLELKRQDTQIILGLKDVIANLIQSLQQKQSSFKEIQEKYSNIMESKVKELSYNKSSTDISEGQLQDISIKSSNRMNGDFKQNKENLDGSEALSSGKNTASDANMRKSKQSSRIDIRKYKEMIENMRNNY